MNPIDALNKINQLVRELQFEQAQKETEHLIASLPVPELKEWAPQLNEVIEKFYKKRKRQLTDSLTSKLNAGGGGQPAQAVQRGRSPELPQFEKYLRDQFINLSDNHIFQWSTFYRDTVGLMFARADTLIQNGISVGEVAHAASIEFAEHASEIYQKGFDYQLERGQSQQAAAEKGLSGIQRFLELPIEVYSARVPVMTNVKSARALRGICSGMLSGILEGFGDVSFADVSGWEYLFSEAFLRAWGHYLGFLTHSDLSRLAGKIPPGEFQEGLSQTALPVVRGIDQVLAEGKADLFCLPRVGELDWDARRLDITLVLPPSLSEGRSYLDVQCFLSQGFVSKIGLEEAAHRDVALVAAPLRPDLQEWVNAHELLPPITINTISNEGNGTDQISSRTFEILSFEISRYTGYESAAPLETNYPSRFPLEKPQELKFMLVHRRSVRELLRIFEHHSGVRLWCSVRRSGKTTASFDLGSSNANTVVVTQTCDDTEQYPGAGVFLQAVKAAFKSGDDLSPSFFRDTVSMCLSAPAHENAKIVFVLDEYETLFGYLGARVRQDYDLRYTIVQPLLNQMVAFSKRNLLVFVGQRPDAHYIIIDQNQLSPYVRQEDFPLFEHRAGTTNSEFCDLLRKAMTNRPEFDGSFADAVFQETSGHPWLTVAVLRDFFDWLIEIKRPVSQLRFTSEDFAQFTKVRLTPDSLGRNKQYELFHQYFSKMLGTLVRDKEPWLYSVHAILRRLVEDEPVKMAFTIPKFEEIVRELQNLQGIRCTADSILRTAVPANFLSIKDDKVMPRIRLMARLCQVATPAVEM